MCFKCVLHASSIIVILCSREYFPPRLLVLQECTCSLIWLLLALLSLRFGYSPLDLTALGVYVSFFLLVSPRAPLTDDLFHAHTNLLPLLSCYSLILVRFSGHHKVRCEFHCALSLFRVKLSIWSVVSCLEPSNAVPYVTRHLPLPLSMKHCQLRAVMLQREIETAMWFSWLETIKTFVVKSNHLTWRFSGKKCRCVHVHTFIQWLTFQAVWRLTYEDQD